MGFIVVAGMHRSGTSLVARVVNLLGVDLGDARHLMEAKPDNPTGFWESLPIARFNDDLLAQLGGRWEDPTPRPDGWEWEPALDPWRDRARGILDVEFEGRSNAGWKDPRMSVLLPFWRTVAEIDKVVVSIRHPMEVVTSLASRDGMSEEAAAGLWLRYTCQALHDAPGAVIVDHRRFSSSIDDSIDWLASELGLRPPDQQTREAVRACVAPGQDRPVPSPETETGATAVWLYETRLENFDPGIVQAYLNSLLLPRAEADVSRLEADLRRAEARVVIKNDALARSERSAANLRDRVGELEKASTGQVGSR